ncbi:hypothetical protein IW139_002741, partial [Coemansia sp. RSA 353]
FQVANTDFQLYERLVLEYMGDCPIVQDQLKIHQCLAARNYAVVPSDVQNLQTQ